MSLQFSDLERLRRTLQGLSRVHRAALTTYYDAPTLGFAHQVAEQKLSKASTATAVISLVAAGEWQKSPWAATSRALAEKLLREDWKSAGLPKGNAFTTAFILEAVTVLEETFPPGMLGLGTDPVNSALIAKAVKILRNSISSGPARILGYPPSGYVTQLVVRTLDRRGELGGREIKVQEWAWRELANQLALVAAKSKTADLFQLAYVIMLVVRLGSPSTINPDQARMLTAALRTLFDHQLEDGSWPRSRPLFHYQQVGSAYCYEYEMLVQLLEEFQRAGADDRLLPYLGKFQTATDLLKPTSYKLPSQALAWSSGHHPQLRGPESWSTASVYHFAHALDRLLAEAVRQAVFEYVDAVYAPPEPPKRAPASFAADLLDSEIDVDTVPSSLKDTIFTKFVKPLVEHEPRIWKGMRDEEPDVPTSAIFFGPPGTAKTDLSKRIADYLGWPRIVIDPSHLTKGGLEHVHAEATTVFGMLAVAERIVVLLDEFDEMLREREIADDVLSRFLTTAMLPKLAAINKQRTIAFIVATNHIEVFDIAIARPGRFDLVVQVMPPTADAKLKKWEAVKDHLTGGRIGLTLDFIRKRIQPLTFDEFRLAVPKLLGATNGSAATEILEKAQEGCTLRTRRVFTDPKSPTWEQVCTEQRNRIRV